MSEKPASPPPTGLRENVLKKRGVPLDELEHLIDQTQLSQAIQRRPPEIPAVATMPVQTELPEVQSKASPALPKPRLRTRFTGRRVQFNHRASADTVERYRALAERAECTIADLIEYGIVLLERDPEFQGKSS